MDNEGRLGRVIERGRDELRNSNSSMHACINRRIEAVLL